MREYAHHRFSGVILPVTTPFDAATGEVAPIGLRENLSRWLAEPIDGLVLFGSTGEGPLLDEDEKLRLVDLARDLVSPDKVLIAGVAADSTRGAIRLARRLAETGADAVLVPPPTYFGPVLAPGALREYFLAVADGSPTPVVVYHIPKYTRVVLEAGLVAELARHPNIVALKDSSGDMKRLGGFADACGEQCRLLVGNGALLYPSLELGAAGGILALGLLAPAGCARIVAHYRAGENRQAGELQERLAPAHRRIVSKYGPAGVKVALDLLGYAGGDPRPPLVSLGEKQRREVARVMQDTGLV